MPTTTDSQPMMRGQRWLTFAEAMLCVGIGVLLLVERAMLELGLLTAMTLVIVVSIILLRRFQIPKSAANTTPAVAVRCFGEPPDDL